MPLLDATAIPTILTSMALAMLFSCSNALLGIATAMDSATSRKSPTWVADGRYLLVLAFLLGLVLAVVYAFAGGLVVQKMVINLVMPAGFCWLLLVLLTVLLWSRRQVFLGTVALLATLVFYLAASPIVEYYLARSLESPYREFSIDRADSYDRLILLGGGTGFGYHLQPQLEDSGDRVMVALHMYQAGKAKRIVCTGTLIAGLTADDEPTPGEGARQLLMLAGVPAGDIELSEGRTTSEEMRNLAKEFADGDLRIGIVTSAWHLPRAMRLAARNGLRGDPIPANFISRERPLNPLFFLPSAGSLEGNAKLLKEYLARLAGQ